MGNALTKEQVVAAFEEAAPRTKWCPLGRLIEESEHGAVIEDRVADQVRYSAATVSRVLKSLGFPPMTPNTISNHRKGTCRCPR
jgi:hypothetical protein